MVACRKQITAYTCVLACLESLLADYGLEVSQERMISECNGLCNGGTPIEGSVPLPNNPRLILRHFVKDADTTIHMSLDMLQNADANFGSNSMLLIQTNHPDEAFHMFRFVAMTSKSQVALMNPHSGSIEDWSWVRLKQLRCYIMEVKLPTPNEK